MGPLDHARVDSEAFAADQILRHAAPQHRLEQLPQQITVAETVMALFEKVDWSGTSPPKPSRQNLR